METNKKEVEQWKAECESFSAWFQALGGNIGSDEQMSEAFRRIEAKNVSDNKLYELLEPKQIVAVIGNNATSKRNVRHLIQAKQ